MPLLDADVLKLQCKFVNKVLNDIKRRKYNIDVDLEDIYTYYTDYALSSFLIDCLEYEDECVLTSTANKYDDEPDDVVVTTPCNTQGALTLSSTSTPCAYTTYLSTELGVSAFPRFTLIPDSLKHPGYITLNATGCEGTFTNEIETGCIYGGGCDPDFWNFGASAVATAYQIAGKYPSGFLTSIRLYETDENGIPSTTPLDIDLTPANIAQWTSCPSCLAVNAADLLFGAADFKDALNTLLENVSRTLYDDVFIDFNVHKRDLISNPGSLQFYTSIKHQPAGRWMCINKDDARITYDKGGSDGVITKIFQPNYEAVTGTKTAAMYEEVTVPTICGDMDIIVRNTNLTGIYPSVNSAATSFYNIVLSDPTSVVPVSIQGDTTIDCTEYELTAVFDVDSASTYAWTNSSDVEVSEQTSFTTSTSDTYTFTLTLTNGCVVTQQITV